MARIKYTRQSGIINIKEFRDNKILIVGCGAVGSFTAISLAKMGLTKFLLYDDDKVEAHNLPNQLFPEDAIGIDKALAVATYMQQYNSEVNVIPFIKKFGINTEHDCSIVICCVDTMRARKQIFINSKKNKVQLFIDTRMAGTQGQVYTVDMEDKKQIANYETNLFSDEEAVQERCTERSIIYTVLGIASLVCNQLVKAFKNEELRNYIVLDYSVPQMM